MLVESALTLGLVPVRLPAVEVAGGRRAERRFLDFLVGGQELGRLMPGLGSTGRALARATPIWCGGVCVSRLAGRRATAVGVQACRI